MWMSFGSRMLCCQQTCDQWSLPLLLGLVVLVEVELQLSKSRVGTYLFPAWCWWPEVEGFFLPCFPSQVTSWHITRGWKLHATYGLQENLSFQDKGSTAAMSSTCSFENNIILLSCFISHFNTSRHIFVLLDNHFKVNVIFRTPFCISI